MSHCKHQQQVSEEITKLKFRVLALRQSELKDCGLCVFI